jgi:hypothetical protein
MPYSSNQLRAPAPALSGHIDHIIGVLTDALGLGVRDEAVTADFADHRDSLKAVYS